MRWLFTISFLFLSYYSNAQQASDGNIVPNPSFEELGSYPLGWFYKGKDFSRLMKYWTSATYASPDVYHPKVRIPIYWTQKGFGIEKPLTGNTMVGITVYGCKEGKPHCREYIQIRLMEPLVIGQQYRASFFTTALQDSKLVNNLGMHFSTESYNETIDDVLELEPQILERNIIQSKGGDWHQVEQVFTAKDTSEYIIIGNFFPDSLTRIDDNPLSYKYAYYYIDDVSVKKEKPIIDEPIKPDDLCCLEYEVGKSFQLKNIFFETAKSELLPQSYKELNKLVEVLAQHPSMVIEIQGHTDNQGSYKYNIKLSRDRSHAVVHYLTSKGVDKDRLYYKGFGDTRPISSNETKEGRQLNRRVEFLIIQK